MVWPHMIDKTMYHRESRVQTAGLNARAAHQRIARKAEAIMEELDDITSPTGRVMIELDDEDSMVVAVASVIELGRTGTDGH